MAIREVTATERATTPYSAVGILIVTWPNGTRSSGTAAVIGRNDILTAAHVIYSPADGGWATRIEGYFGADYNKFIEGLDSSTFTYQLRGGTFRYTIDAWGSSVFTTSDAVAGRITPAQAQYDVAVIGVSVPIGDSTGTLRLDAGFNTAQTFTQVGYPAGSTGMMTGTVAVTRDSTYEVYTAATSELGSGSSGGPLLTSGGLVVGVKSTASDSRSTWADIGWMVEAIRGFTSDNDWLLQPGATTADPPAPTPKYSVTAGTTAVNEGSTVAFTVVTQNVASGTRLNYTLSGVSAADVTGGALTGTATVGSDGRATVNVGLVSDASTEGEETLVFTTNGASASVTVNDTSTSANTQAASEVRDAIAVHRAFYGVSPTSTEYATMGPSVTIFGLAEWVMAYNAKFASTSHDALSTKVLLDMGINPFTLYGANPTASYNALQTAVMFVFQANAGVRAQVVLNMCRLLAGLENDTVYGVAARAFNANVSADYLRLHGTAAPGDDLMALQLLGVTGADPFTFG